MKQIFALLLAIIAVFVVAPLLTMVLWNWLMPVIFGLVVIDFWQAMGLLALTSLLFYHGK